METPLHNAGWTDFDLTTIAIPKNSWWFDWLTAEMQKPYFKMISEAIAKEHEGLESNFAIFPPKQQVFRAFESSTPPRIVLIGQDPYQTPGNAMGLSFSVPRGQPRPASLLNVYKELIRDEAVPFAAEPPKHGDLTSWADQSVMLLNTALTVCEGDSGSHNMPRIGWPKFTQSVLEHINRSAPPGVVFILWGGFAQKLEKYIDVTKHHVLKGGHPSPLNRSAKFVGCGHFSRANELLQAGGYEPIRWNSICE